MTLTQCFRNSNCHFEQNEESQTTTIDKEPFNFAVGNGFIHSDAEGINAFSTYIIEKTITTRKGGCIKNATTIKIPLFNIEFNIYKKTFYITSDNSYNS